MEIPVVGQGSWKRNWLRHLTQQVPIQYSGFSGIHIISLWKLGPSKMIVSFASMDDSPLNLADGKDIFRLPLKGGISGNFWCGVSHASSRDSLMKLANWSKFDHLLRPALNGWVNEADTFVCEAPLGPQYQAQAGAVLMLFGQPMTSMYHFHNSMFHIFFWAFMKFELEPLEQHKEREKTQDVL